MPRGIPNARRDETGMKYTTFHVPLPPNPKYSSSTYIKSEAQTLWYRNAKKYQPVTNGHAATDQPRGHQTLVIHPGTQNFRIGRASDLSPVVIPAIVARKTSAPVPRPTARCRVPRPADPNEPISPNTADPTLSAIAAIQNTLYSYMSYLNIPGDPNAARIASEANANFTPTTVPDSSDPFRVNWIRESERPYLLGNEVQYLADPPASGYSVKQPIHGVNFNADYPSLQAVLADIDLIIRETLRTSFDIHPRDYHQYSVVLVIPDFYETNYVRELVNLFLVQMGFKQLCAQQESLAATYGSGTSSACVINFGAASTSIACVDEGIVNPDTRIVLDIGGDDVTEFLYVILQCYNFPYRDCDLARMHDWRLLQTLKQSICTLEERHVALKRFDFTVRNPGKGPENYTLQAYDAVILAPMAYFHECQTFLKFEPYAPPYYQTDTTEEIMEPPAEHLTETMKRVTAHLMPLPMTMQMTMPGEASKSANTSTPSGSKTTSASPADDASMDVDGEEPKPAPEQPPTPPKPKEIDVYLEASKTPLDAAVYNSMRMMGEDRVIKYLNAILLVGGPANMPGLAHALEARLQSAAIAVMQSNEVRTQVIPPPKDVDPSVLVWKGAAVLGKMEGVSELWVTPADWDLLGMRGLKERCFYL